MRTLITLVLLFLIQLSVCGEEPLEYFQSFFSSPLARYANGVWVIEAEEDALPEQIRDHETASSGKVLAWTGDHWNSRSLNLTPGQYHFRLVFRSLESDLPQPATGELRLESSHGTVLRQKQVPAALWEQAGRWACLDLDAGIPIEDDYRLVFSFSHPISLEIDAWTLSPRFTSNIPPIASADHANKLDTSSGIAKRNINLNRQWQLQPARDDLLFFPDPQAWDETPIKIPSPWNVNRFNKVEGGPDYVFFPSYPESWEELEAAWLRTNVWIPPLENQPWRLHFEAVMYSAEVYVNDVYIGYHEGGFDPFTFDISEAIRPGEENEIRVGVRSWRPYTIQQSRPFPWGSFWGAVISGIWQDVRLETGGPVEIHHIKIETLAEPNRLRLRYEFLNQTDQALLLDASPRILLASPEYLSSSTIPQIPTFQVEAAPRSVTVHTLEVPWAEPHWWEPEHPVLYTAETMISHDGKVISAHREQFGFRIFENRGRHLYLNGRRIKLHGDTWHFTGVPMLDRRYPALWYDLCRKNDLNFVRLHAQVYPRYYVTTADETGMLIIDESSHWASGLLMWYDEDYTARMRNHLLSLVRRDWNSPSVIAWSVANEVLGGYSSWSYVNVKSEEELYDLFGNLMQEVRQWDSTRLVFSSGDEDMNGHADWVSYHYPGTYPIPSRKPITMGETTSLYYAAPTDVAYLGGEEVFRSWAARCQAVAQEYQMQMASYRKWAELITAFNVVWYAMQPLPFDDSPPILEPGGVLPERYGRFSSTLNPGVSSQLPPYLPNPAYEGVSSALRAVQIFPQEYDSHFYSGQFLSRLFTLHNDTREDGTFQVVITASIEEMDFLREIQREVNVASCEYEQVAITVDVPVVNQITPLDFIVRIQRNGETVVENAFEYHLHPRPEEPTISLPKGRRVAVLERLPMYQLQVPGTLTEIKNWAELASSPEWKDGVLIIGEGVEMSAEQAEYLLDAVQRQGLRVAMLEDCPGLVEGDRFLQSNRADYFWLFPSSGTHPITDGLTPCMLSHWMPHRWIARRSFDGWLGRRARPLIASGAGETTLLEIQEGAGLLLYSGLELRSQQGRNPVVDIITRRIIQRLLDYETQSTHQVILIADAESSAAALLDRLAVDYVLYGNEQSIPNRDEASPLLILDAEYMERMNLGSFVSELDSALKDGAQLLVWNLAPSHQEWLHQAGMLMNARAEWSDALLQLPLEEVDALQLVSPEEAPPQVAGIHLSDLYQLERQRGETIIEYGVWGRAPGIESLLEVPQLDWRRWVIPWQTEPYHLGSLYRALEEPMLPVVAFGKVLNTPSVYLYQIPPDAPGVKNRRVMNQVLTNLGARFREDREMRGVFSMDSDGFIRTWWVKGPFFASGQEELLQKDFLLSEGGQAIVKPSEQTGWSLYSSEQPLVDLVGIPGIGQQRNAVIYLSVYIHSPRRYGEILDSPEALGLSLNLGSDDGMTIWLNGDEILRVEEYRPHVFEENSISPIRLRAGWNRLMVRVFQGDYAWQFSARLAGRDSQAVRELIVSPYPD